jgi:predicted aldo/keto reductase-like oxidoreductase
MRFPRNFTSIDMKKAEEIIMTAFERGVNYFDTAWMYPGSEECLGTILEKNGIRDKVYIASKLPIALVKKTGDFERFFSEELRRLKTDRIDYYLMHMLTDLSFWKSLLSLGIDSWIAEKKRSGQIRQIGFSFHGSGEEFLQLLDAYPWEFCLIQYNYSDENFQAGIRGLRKAAGTMPVIIMEPLLGGRLVNGLPKGAERIFNGARNRDGKPLSPAAWGLRWVYNQEEAAVVLSGMSSVSQLIENAELADATAAGSLSPEELDVYRRVREVFNASYKIRCTGCGYCMPCPRGVNIPGCFATYNTSYAMGLFTGIKQYATTVGISAEFMSGPSNCIACGKCEGRCPQKIPIAEGLRRVRRRMEPPWVSIAIAGMRAFLGRKSRRAGGEAAGFPAGPEQP